MINKWLYLVLNIILCNCEKKHWFLRMYTTDNSISNAHVVSLDPFHQCKKKKMLCRCKNSMLMDDEVWRKSFVGILGTTNQSSIYLHTYLAYQFERKQTIRIYSDPTDVVCFLVPHFRWQWFPSGELLRFHFFLSSHHLSNRQSLQIVAKAPIVQTVSRWLKSPPNQK